MSSRQRPSQIDITCDDALYRKLSQCGTQTGIVTALNALHDAGLLSETVAIDRKLKRKLAAGPQSHCAASTPYGPLVQNMPLPLAKLPQWSYCHPMALVWYLSKTSTGFADAMLSGTPGVPLRIVIYIDEICPGNPFRPEKSRTLQAIYWAVLEWPQWLLQRTAIWPTFGTIRSGLVEQLPGGVSGLMRLVLNTFWSADNTSFAKGVTIVHPRSDAHIVTARFAGFLCDEKAHNQVTGCKGASGIPPFPHVHSHGFCNDYSFSHLHTSIESPLYTTRGHVPHLPAPNLC